MSKAALANLVAQSRPAVTCHTLRTDRYGRSVATCSVTLDGQQVDVGAWMVGHGYALRYPAYDTKV